MSARRRALISVSDKRGIVDLAQALHRLSFEIVSTGGTAAVLRAAGVGVIDVEDLTGFPEIMDGRVKTLHPKIHAGLLARPGIDDAVLAEHGIQPFDLVAVNLYPFARVAAQPEAELADAIEHIDIGGPAMLRAAAKNHERVTVVVESEDYARVAEAFAAGEPPLALRRSLAAKAFAHTARYDGLIARYLDAQASRGTAYPERLVLGWDKAYELRYGENPHQRAALYLEGGARGGTAAGGTLLQGKPLSYNNLLDADAAVGCAADLSAPACVIVKHMNPCGAAVAEDVLGAYEGAYAADPISAFGGIIAFNRPLDGRTAQAIVARQRADVVAAPSVAPEARAAFAGKPNVRIIETGAPAAASAERLELRSIAGGLLVQQPDRGRLETAELRTVTRRAPDEREVRDLLFAWTIVKHVKSNAIVYAAQGRTLGIGAGQTSRVMSARIAGLKAAEQNLPLAGAVMASDAFLPFRDGLDVAAELGIRAVIQPGGSVRDREVNAAADEHGIAMVFTAMRHFRH
jgi:phosphoribosylaminoimidazolecarboxamide formyltransferase/IMP cyclohydrolase